MVMNFSSYRLGDSAAFPVAGGRCVAVLKCNFLGPTRLTLLPFRGVVHLTGGVAGLDGHYYLGTSQGSLRES